MRNRPRQDRPDRNVPTARPNSATIGRALAVLALGLVLQSSRPAAIQPVAAPQGVTVTAVAADAPLPMPSSNAHGFENLLARIPFPPPVPPYVVYGPWRAFGTSGIKSNGSALLGSLTAPQGVSVGYVSGDGLLRCSYTLQPGIWRLRYQGAARSTGGVAEQQVLQISIGGVVLSQHEYTAAFASYTTRPIDITSAMTVDVEFQGLDPNGAGDTAFVDQILLERISDWQDGSTWNPGLPDATNPVTIPSDALVALRGSCAALTVTLEGGLLAPNASSTLDAKWVRVTGDQALFQVGTADLPFQEDFTLTLTGTMTDPFEPGGGTKFLVAQEGGTIDLHGEPRVSWTKLDATADDTTTPPILTFADDIDWKKNDWLIIAGSKSQDITPGTVPYGADWHDFAEKVQILEVLGPRSVKLTQQLQELHFGGAPVDYPTGGSTWQLDQRAEVGLLTHNVKVQGDASSDLFQPLTGHGWVGFGGHIMIRPSSEDPATGRLSNVELYRMGQSKVGLSMGLGRYPMHWHMNLDAGEGQYIEHSSIHHTYNRAVTIHGTEHVRVEWNVAYDNLGHALFLEDGSERFNHINYNLVLSTQIPDAANALLDSDHFGKAFQNQSPASFWITNPNNEMIGNVAAGTVGTGFWFALPRDPAGMSASEPYFTELQPPLHPNQEPLDTFRDNVCHGARSAFDVNDAFDVNHTIQTNVAWLPPTTAFLEDFTVYSCNTGLYAGTGDGDLVFTNNVLADNSRSIVFAAYHTVEDSVVIADSGHGIFTFPANPGAPEATAYSIYDGAGTLRNSHLVGYHVPGSSVIHNQGGAIKHVNHVFEGLTFEPLGALEQVMHLPDFAAATQECGNTPQSLYDPRKWMVAIRDLDGSLTGLPGITITGNHPMMNRTIATGALRTYLAPEDIRWDPTEDVWLSPSRFGQLRIRHNNFVGNPVQGPDMTFTRDPHPLWTSNSYLNCSTVDQHKQFPIVVGEGYEYGVDWGGGLPAATDHIVATLDDVGNLDDGTVRLVWDGAKNQIQVSGYADRVYFSPTAYPDLPSLQAGATTGYFIPADQSVLWLRYVSAGERQIELELQNP